MKWDKNKRHIKLKSACIYDNAAATEKPDQQLMMST
jgi:hypothetical protein